VHGIHLRSQLSDDAHRFLLVRTPTDTCTLAPVNRVTGALRWAPRVRRAIITLSYLLPARLALHRRRHAWRCHSAWAWLDAFSNNNSP
jgi:hypothetical protein